MKYFLKVNVRHNGKLFKQGSKCPDDLVQLFKEYKFLEGVEDDQLKIEDSTPKPKSKKEKK